MASSSSQIFTLTHMSLKLQSIAIIEDDDTVRQYLAKQVQLNIEVGELNLFKNGEDALLALSENPATIVLFDVQLPGMSGIECMRKLKTIHPQMLCMVLTVYDKPDTVFEALKAGAVSYLLKSTSSEKILEAIEEVYNGGSPISSQIARKVIETFALKEKTNEHFQLLSRREKEIVEELARGYRYKEIADKLFLSVDTVRTHIRNIYEKLQVNCRIEALRKTGLI
jgi:DNA-binding NarL/FixJ family response regulator